jgi:hypothetical protein
MSSADTVIGEIYMPTYKAWGSQTHGGLDWMPAMAAAIQEPSSMILR